MASFKNLVSTTSAQISSGGTITGDLVINGDLQVDGGGSLSFDEIVQGTSTITVTDNPAFLVEKADGTDVFIVDTTNSRVGIGGTPTQPLNIFHSSHAIALLESSGTDSASSVQFKNDARTYQIGVRGSASDSFIIRDSTATTDRFTIKSDGEVLITPSGANLDVSGAPNGSLSMGSPSSTLQASVLGRTTSNATALHLFASATDANTLGDMRFNVRENNDSTFATLTNPAFKFIHYTTDLVTILRDGSVGINTDPESALHLNTTSSGGIGGKLIIDNQASDADGNGTEISFFNAAGASASGVSSSRIRSVASGNTNGYSQLQFWTYHASEGQRMTLSSDGKLGIGTTSPDALLDLTSSTGYANLRLGQNKTNQSAQRAGISAQPYLTAEEPTAGMFMFIDGTGSTQDTADLQLGGGHGSFNAVKQIKFYTASDAVTTSGTEVMRLDANSRISLSNNDSGGTNNTIFGYQAGLNVTTNGDMNTLIGHTAGVELTSGEDNTGIGWRSIFDIKEGGFNTAVGSSSLGGQHGSTADASAENVAIGYSAMGGNFDNSATTDQCVAVGALTMNGALNDVDGTVAVGYKSLLSLTSGAGNTAVGYQSLDATATGARNTALGYQALTALTDYSDNTAIGYNALDTGTSASHNTAVGSNAGDVITTGDYNTIIGSGADPSGDDGQNQTVIGYNATGVADNSVTLGNTATTQVYVAPHASEGGPTQQLVFRDNADKGIINYDHNNGMFKITVEGVEHSRFASGGDLILMHGGVNFLDAEGTSASADANTLDDYEEGTYTPVVSNGSTTYSASVENGYYTKIGDQVFVQVFITSSEAGSGSSALHVTLPFNYNGASNKRITTSVRTENVDVDSSCVQLMLANASSGTSDKLFFTQMRDNAGQLSLPASSYLSGGTIQFNVHYKVA